LLKVQIPDYLVKAQIEFNPITLPDVARLILVASGTIFRDGKGVAWQNMINHQNLKTQ